jgi:hypothetical protein
MPRKPARLGETDVRRIVSAYRKEGLSVRVMYQPDGSTVFEPVVVVGQEQQERAA